MRHRAIAGWNRRTFPTGWFQVAWSPELEPGQLAARRYWGRDLVVWRSESGAVHLMEAHEGRRGLDLTRWGQVEGESIRCILDGWQWQPDGTARDDTGAAVDVGALRSFPAVEISGLVLAWYDENGDPPSWSVEGGEEATSPDYYPAWPHGAVLDLMSCQPQVMAENIADVVHVRYAHRWLDIPTITEWDDSSPRLEVGYEGNFPSPRGPVHAVFHNTAWGFGVMRTSMTSIRKFVHYICPTPIDHTMMDVRLSAWVERAPDDTGDRPDSIAAALIRAQRDEVLGPNVDRSIWENQAYMEQPAFRSQERQYVQFRRWCAQFYPHEPRPQRAASR
ncbi:Rieske 2Fe-2S domain-containing protein [Sporichthya brevicatena]|uniref:cholesterol 7-desaturase n=1 Tax=Sporichthya brevicatena TaxID=171442 RepID=A0ABN1GNU5_9ACTN